MLTAIGLFIGLTLGIAISFWGALVLTGSMTGALWGVAGFGGLILFVRLLCAALDSNWYWHWKHRHDRYDAAVPPQPFEAKTPGEASAEYPAWGQTDRVCAADQLHQPGEFVPGSFDLLGAADNASCATCPKEFAHYAEMSLEIIRQENRASTSLLQRRLNFSFELANALISELERRGVLGPGEGAEPREILVDLNAPV